LYLKAFALTAFVMAFDVLLHCTLEFSPRHNHESRIAFRIRLAPPKLHPLCTVKGIETFGIA
jgi:hypothetical protein